MKEILVSQFGLTCWGCNYIPPDEKYLHLDHINPRSAGGTNDIDNRTLLCQPCNGMKSNAMSLIALRGRNKKERYIQENPPINLPEALAWTRPRVIELVRTSEYQTTINGRLNPSPTWGRVDRCKVCCLN